MHQRDDFVSVTVFPCQRFQGVAENRQTADLSNVDAR